MILPNLGMMLGILVATVVPIFLLMTGNGAAFWFLVNAIIAYVFYHFWFKKNSVGEDGLTHEDVGRFKSVRDKESQEIIFKTAILAGMMFVYLYFIVAVSQMFLGIEFRYMWPVFKAFTPTTFGQFLLYIIPIFPFFLVNGGVFLFGMIKQPESTSPILKPTPSSRLRRTRAFRLF